MVFLLYMSHTKRRKAFVKKAFKEFIFLLFSLGIIAFAVVVGWLASMELPDFNNFENRAIANSTKIYDRTGKIVLYNIHDNIKRTEIPLSEMSPYIKQATIAIEDAHFYEHYGFRPVSFVRAVLANFRSGSFSQGGSTLNQQIVKNALLTREKTVSRKLKEIVLAIKLDRELPKDIILQIYLNESPYGGTLYGIEEASLAYFGKHAKDLSLTESAYLASLPQSPTRLSPYGKNRELLEARKNLVLERMFELGYITEQEKITSQGEKLSFEVDVSSSGKALHFIFYLREYLEQTYGEDVVVNGGLKVISTLDYELQKKMEDTVREGALENAKKFNANNSALVAIDPRTGQILSLVGSRDFFDKEIPGQFNIATAARQPGSSFKPIVYAAAFLAGYTPETVLFDVPTQFSSLCDSYGNPKPGVKPSACYMPENYDETFRGPISLRNALAQSLNVPAVKLLYLVGLDNAIRLANKLGLSTINDPARYGLSLVLGGGEITLLELTNAYGVFANNGVYHKPIGILEVRDRNDVLLEKFSNTEEQVLPEYVASLVSSVLADKEAKRPAYGVNSPLFFGDRPVASKTGTTNDYRDLWVVGYTPSIVVGMWAGNNDNTPIEKKVAGLILAPVWHKAMDAVISGTPIEYFPEPLPNTKEKPVLRGVWCQFGGIHEILHYVVRGDPDGPAPINPSSDSQYLLWEEGLGRWLEKNQLNCAPSPQTQQGEVSTSSTVEIN